MKKIYYLLLLLISIGSYAQNEVFRIDSLPKQGILLDKGWKFHAGDNPDFVKPDFDDTQWESIDPTKDVMDLKQFGDKNIGWFRLTFKVDSALFGQTFALAVKQTGSSQVFMNEVLVKQIGDFSTKTQASKGYDPAGIGYRITFGNKSLQVLAVKFEKPNIFLLKHILYPNDCLKLRIIQTEHIINNYLYNETQDFIGLNFGYINVGIYFVIALFHLVLFIANNKSISNLLLFIYTLLVSLLFASANYSFYSIDIDLRNHISTIILTIYPFLSFIALYAFYKLFEIKNIFILRTSILLSFFSEVLLFVFYDWGYIIPQLIPLFNAIVFYIIADKAYKNGDKAAKFISLSITIGIVFIALSLVLRSFLRSYNLSPLLFHVLYNVGSLLQSGSFIYYFAYHFNKNWRNLQKKLLEVETLSTEKYEVLQKQNAELQAALLKGQTIERQRVALDLHDNLGSTLSALWLSVDTIDKSKMNDEEKEIHQNLRENLEKAYNDVRLLSHNLLPEEFEKQGLTTILQGFVRKMNKTQQ